MHEPALEEVQERFPRWNIFETDQGNWWASQAGDLRVSCVQAPTRRQLARGLDQAERANAAPAECHCPIWQACEHRQP